MTKTAATSTQFAVFDTAIGRCGIAWQDNAIVGIQLPEGSEAQVRARLRQRFPGSAAGAPPPAVQRAIDDITALIAGEERDLSCIALDMTGVPDFPRRVYEAARAIPPGSTATYGDIAKKVGGGPGAARAVGHALGRNPFAIVVPCHRVVAANGKLGGFSANGGVATKVRLLSIETAMSHDRGTLFEGDGELSFDRDAAVEELCAADPLLAGLIDSIGPFTMRLDRAPSTFAALAEAIVYQQLTGRVAATIYARVCALFPHGHRGLTAEAVLRAPDTDLRGAGLSNAKLLALKDLARRTVDGSVPSLADVQSMTDDEIVARLSEVRGIGRWTAEMFLIFRLGRPDVLPVDDYGIRKGFALAFNRELPAPKELAEYGERWRPYRTVASWYLWRAVEHGAEREPDATG